MSCGGKRCRWGVGYHYTVLSFFLLVLAAAQQDGIPNYQHEGDPPRIAARSLYEYRHLQLFNIEYLEWVRKNIHTVTYETLPSAFDYRWQSLSLAAAEGQPEVVMVTQTTVSRLSAFNLVAKEWRGPVSAAVYIEFPQATYEAMLCRQRVTSYLSHGVLATGWPPNTEAPPMVVSFLHATKANVEASCNVPGMPAEPTGNEATEDDLVARAQRPDDVATDDDDGDGHDGDIKDDGSAGNLRIVSDGDGDDSVLTVRRATRFGGPVVPQHVTNRFRGVQPRSRLLHGAAQGGLPEGGVSVSDGGGGARGVQSVSDDIVVPGLKQIWRVQPHVRGKLPLVTERPWREMYAGFYPVNSLRNLAWAQVPSGLFVFLNDIDFIPTPDMHRDLVVGKFRADLLHMRAAYATNGTRIAFVTPAFERLSQRKPSGAVSMDNQGQPLGRVWPGQCEEEHGCSVLRGMALPRSFKMLRTMMQHGGVVDIFHRRIFVAGHNCYSWLSWFQEESPAEMISMDYHHPCEPYVIALSDALPRYDERFRGRGQNKVEQLAHMAAWGFKWKLLPAHFVMHVPHASTKAQEGGWDVATTPIALLKVMLQEVQNEPQFRRHVPQDVPQPIQVLQQRRAEL